MKFKIFIWLHLFYVAASSDEYHVKIETSVPPLVNSTLTFTATLYHNNKIADPYDYHFKWQDSKGHSNV
uniref:Uncharacterized protein n=1 Tax=Megaselia scalaris TaxID=36166 RepID=T1GRN1_MEGSC